VKLICKVGEGVLARLGRVEGDSAWCSPAARSSSRPPKTVQGRLEECGIPFWPHGFVTAHCDMQGLLENWTNEYACLGYGEELYPALADSANRPGSARWRCRGRPWPS